MSEWIVDILKTTGGIILAALPLLVPQVRDFVVKRYQLSLDKALEDKKSKNARKEYIIKASFDKEFEIIQELSERMVAMVFNFAELVRTIQYDQEDDRAVIEKVWQAAVESYNEANRTTRKYAPFISESIYKSFIQLGDKCRNQLKYYCSHYKDLPLEKEWESIRAFVTRNTPDYSKFETEEKFEEKFKVNHQDISSSLDILMSALRTHISKRYDLYDLKEDNQ